MSDTLCQTGGVTDYTPPLADIDFVLQQCGLDDIASLPDFSHVDVAAVPDLISEAGRFFAQTIAPLNAIGDQVGSVHNPDNTVTTPPGFAEAYQQYVDAGWGAVSASPEYDGGGFPFLVGVVLEELMSTANLSFSMCPLLSQGASRLLEAHGSDAIKATYMPKMITGEWTGTMCLTEPEAGSDLGVIRTKAEPQADGTYRITGTKIFITFGEHDFADQIVHLVLARTPDAPTGTKGISCFVVPKYLVNADGSLGARNDATCLSIEHKMGIKASPTCVLSFGEHGEGAERGAGPSGVEKDAAAGWAQGCGQADDEEGGGHDPALSVSGGAVHLRGQQHGVGGGGREVDAAEECAGEHGLVDPPEGGEGRGGRAAHDHHHRRERQARL